MICIYCGSSDVEWEGPASALTHTRCKDCGATDCHEPEEDDVDEDSEEPEEDEEDEIRIAAMADDNALYVLRINPRHSGPRRVRLVPRQRGSGPRPKRTT